MLNTKWEKTARLSSKPVVFECEQGKFLIPLSVICIVHKNNYLTLWSRYLAKLTVAHLIRRFLSCLQRPVKQEVSLKSILNVSYQLQFSLPSGLFPSEFSINILYAVLISPCAHVSPISYSFTCSLQ